jgi:hypothetical protein
MKSMRKHFCGIKYIKGGKGIEQVVFPNGPRGLNEITEKDN